jgi:hypothetical protein
VAFDKDFEEESQNPAMSNRYKIRMYESGDGDGCVVAGTIVVPIDRSFSVFAETADEAERKIQKDVVGKKLAGGRVYQICPQVGNAELIRSVAISESCEVQRIFLDPAKGLYSEFRRIRHPQPQPATPAAALPEAVGA